MNRRASPILSLPLATALLLAIASAGCQSQAERSATPIAEKNAAARGGLDAWRAVKTLSMSGVLEAGKPRSSYKQALASLRPRPQAKAAARKALAHAASVPEERPVQLPFVMELERPRKSRLEVRFQGQTAVQVYDGKRGWKLRPYLGRREVEPYSAEELRQAEQQTELDGLLIDHAAKGSKVTLLGKETVDGRDTYKLEVQPKRGDVRHLWVDAETYLDVKVDGSRKLDGKPRPVFTYFRDYRKVGGLMIPHLLETYVEGVVGSEKIIVERVAVNPRLDDARFGKPD